MTSAAVPRPRRRLVGDVVVVLGVAWAMVVSWTIFQTLGSGEGMPGRGDWRHSPPNFVRVTGLGWATVAVTALGLALRRSLPGYLIGLLGVAGYLWSGGAPVAAVLAAAVLVVGLYAHRSPRTGWPWLLLLPPAFAAANPLEPGEWFGVVTMIAWTLLPAGAALAVRARHKERARQRAEELERIAHAERLRVARDIHDVVGHSLSLISLQSGVALRVLDDDPAQARESLEAIRSTSKDALAEVRRTLGVFRDDEAPLAPTPDLDTIGALVDQVRATGVSVDYRCLLPRTGVPASVQAVAHRIVQEGLTNAMRHAPGAAVTVDVERRGQRLVVRVHDDGPGEATIVEGGGLTGMRERVAAIGGSLVVASGEAGFTVTAELPLEEEQ